MGHSHDHSHDHHPTHDHHAHGGHGHHDHTPSVTAGNERRIRLVLLLTATYALVQAIGGWLAGSLALIADSGHMISDAAALALALVAYRFAARAPDKRRTYGFDRVRVLAALANGAMLLLLVAWIVWEAISRFQQPVEVMAVPMLIVASIGLVVNIVGAVVLSSGNRGDSNLRGALLHVVGDLLGSVGAIAAALGIMWTGWTILDPLLSIGVALLVVRSAWRLVSESIQVLLQTTPAGLDPSEIQKELKRLEGIDEAGHFHAWTLTDDRTIATVHVTPKPGVDPLKLPARVTAHLQTRHKLSHVTVQVDPPGSLAMH